LTSSFIVSKELSRTGEEERNTKRRDTCRKKTRKNTITTQNQKLIENLTLTHIYITYTTKFNTSYSQVAIMATIVAITTHTSNAFSIQSVAANSRMKTSSSSSRTTPYQQLTSRSTSTLYMNTYSPEEQMVADDEISRLKIMAQKIACQSCCIRGQTGTGTGKCCIGSI
jgi:hypothetical protein